MGLINVELERVVELAGDGEMAVGKDEGLVPLDTCRGEDVTQDMSVFFCTGKDLLRLLVPLWLLLERAEGVLWGVCDSTVLSLDFGTLPAMLSGSDAAMLSLSPTMIGSSGPSPSRAVAGPSPWPAVAGPSSSPTVGGPSPVDGSSPVVD